MALTEVRYAAVLLCLCALATVLGSQLHQPSSGTLTTSLYHHRDPEPTKTTSLPTDSVTNCPSVCTCEPDRVVYCPRKKLLDIPEGLPNKTMELYFDINLLTYLDSHMFRNLRLLKVFTALQNHISDVKKGTFSELSQLMNVELSNNPLLLPSIENVLCSMPFIFTTSLLFNNIFEHEQVTLSKETFACLRQKHVDVLRLANNNFGQFPDGVFSELNVSYLSLSNTSSSGLNTRAFLGTHHIGGLNLGLNHLRYIPRFSLSGVKLIPDLTYLSLDNNPLERLTIEDMKGLKDLETLRMNGISHGFHALRVEPGFTLDLLPNLKEFLFRYNFLFIVSPEKSLFQSTLLTYLSVALSIFSPRAVEFGNMPNLQTLIAKGIAVYDLASYTATAFQNLSNLVVLNLHRSRLTDLPSNMFKGSHNIKKLDLSFNSLTALNIGVFAGLHSLQSLDISSNSILILDPGFFRPEGPFVSQLTSVQVQGNPLICSCNLLQFVEYVRRHVNIFKDIKYTICAFPPTLEGTSLLDAPISPSDCAIGLPMPFYISVTASGIFLLLLLTGSFVYKYRWHVRYMYFQMKSKNAIGDDEMDLTRYTYDAFVSYNAQSIQWVKDILLPLLEKKMGLKLCLHDRDWLAGIDIVDNIAASIDGSRKVILVVTNAFARSQWCHLELTMAQHRLLEKDKNNTILIKIEDIHDYNMSPRLALQMKTQTYIEWQENNVKAQELFEKKIKHAMKLSSVSMRLQAV